MNLSVRGRHGPRVGKLAHQTYLQVKLALVAIFRITNYYLLTYERTFIFVR